MKSHTYKNTPLAPFIIFLIRLTKIFCALESTISNLEGTCLRTHYSGIEIKKERRETKAPHPAGFEPMTSLPQPLTFNFCQLVYPTWSCHWKQIINKCQPILVQGLRRDIQMNFHIKTIYVSVAQWISAWLWIWTTQGDFFSLKFIFKRKWTKWWRTRTTRTTTQVIPWSLADGRRQK